MTCRSRAELTPACASLRPFLSPVPNAARAPGLTKMDSGHYQAVWQCPLVRSRTPSPLQLPRPCSGRSRAASCIQNSGLPVLPSGGASPSFTGITLIWACLTQGASEGKGSNSHIAAKIKFLLDSQQQPETKKVTMCFPPSISIFVPLKETPQNACFA